MKKEKSQIFKTILPLTKGYRHHYVIAAIATVLGVAFNFLPQQIIRVTVDSVIDTKPLALPQFLIDGINQFGGVELLRNNLYLCALAVLAVALVTALCEFISRSNIAKGSEGILRSMRNKMYDYCQRLPFSWHAKQHTGDLVQRCTSVIDIIRNFIAGQIVEMFRTVVLVVLSMSLMFSMNVKLSLIALIFMPVIVLYSLFFCNINAKTFKQVEVAEGELYATTQENLTGVRVVKAFGRERYEIERFQEKNQKFTDLFLKFGYQLGYYWGVGDLVTGIQVLTVILVGVFETVGGSITLGEYMTFVSYNFMLVWPIRNFGRILSEMSKAQECFLRVDEVLREQPEEDDPDGLEPDMEGDIVFSHVSFNYSGLQPMIKDVSFTIKQGQTFAILGATGSGKSTLMYLLNRLYDVPRGCGSITIGGVDIRDIKLSWLRSHIGMVLQEPFLFSKSIRENIGIHREDIDLAEIRRAAQIAAVDNAIISFEDGYDTEIGERGVTLSGGQKQRVAIARMLTKKTPIMVFDDSLSAVDTETDIQIRRALEDIHKEATTILISHRITTIMHADQILVLDNGKVSDLGTHEELIARDGIYKHIYEIQMGIDGPSEPEQEKEGEDRCR